MDMTTNWSFPSNISLHPELEYCPDVTIYFLAFTIIRTVIILPFAIVVLYLGHQQWWQQHKTMSQSDRITYHFAFMQLFGVPGLTIYIGGFYAPCLLFVGSCIFSVVVIGELLFHTVTCVERYLAVVHPIAYLELNSTKGTKIRRFCVGGVWLVAFGWIIPLVCYAPYRPIVPFFCLFSLCFVIISFCSLSVLCALIRPGPGEVAGEKEQVDPSKLKAFHTIMVITGALLVWFTGYVCCIALDTSKLLSYTVGCWVIASSTWFSLPSSLVVPLLFLHRAGKLRCCCVSAK